MKRYLKVACLAGVIAVLANVYAKFQASYPRKHVLSLAQVRFEGPAVFSIGTKVEGPDGKPTTIDSIGNVFIPT